MAGCANPFDALRLRVEDLGPTLYTRGAYKDPWLNLVRREEWPVGAGLSRSAFSINRSLPESDEETWQTITVTTGQTYTGSCGVTYNSTYVGYKEVLYAPEKFGLVGPLVCQDDLTLFWNSADFWEKYMVSLEQRNILSITNRLENIFGTYATKVTTAANGHVSRELGDVTTQPPASKLNLGAVSIPQCGLTQDILDQEAVVLMEDGATQPDSQGWITMGASGPEFPLLIGVEASNQLLLNNSDLRTDIRYAYEGMGDAHPLLQRLGATLIIKNWRHVITLYPPRWKVVNGAMVRVPRFVKSTNAADSTKGGAGIKNPDWEDPTIATIEGAYGLNPWVFTEEVLRPVNSAPGMRWTAQNYFGEWRFVTGNDALIGFPDCAAGTQDPTHKMGRHVAEYRHAAKPIFPEYGRLFLFARCPKTISCLTCAS